MKFVFLSFILFFTLHVSAQKPDEIYSKIRASVETGNYQTAIDELHKLEKSDRKLLVLNNYDYLLARLSEKTGNLATAMANYQAVADRNSVLSEYAFKHLAQIARASGNLMLERIYLQQLLTVAPDSLLNDAAEACLARSFFDSKDFAAAIRLLNSQKNSSPDEQKPKTGNQKPISANQIDYRNPKQREKLSLLAQAFQQNGQPDAAREIFTKLITELPNAAQPDDFALVGAKGLDEIEVGLENIGKTVAALDDFGHFRRASIYQFNRDFPEARLHYKALVERFPQSPNFADALYQIGRGYVQERNYAEAINWFERAQAEFPDSDTAKDALMQTASAYSRLNKPKEAIARYRKFIEKYPNAVHIERAYLNIVDVLRDQGEDFEALKWTAKTQETFRGKLPEAVALFAQTRIHIAQNDWQNALGDLTKLQTFTDLGNAEVPGSTSKAEITFLKGLVLENLNRFAETIDVYLSIPDGRGEYYGWRATERLRALANDEKTRKFIERKTEFFNVDMVQLTPEQERNLYQPLFRLTGENDYLERLKKIYAQLPAYKTPTFKLLEFGRREILKEKREDSAENRHKIIADELLFLGLYDEATPELETILTENGKRKTENAANDESNSKSAIQNPKSDNAAYTLAVFYKRGDIANRAVAFAEPLWKNVPADYQIELIPRDQIELLYPAPYADSLLKFAAPKNVDSRFILSIIRQESRYRADVKSYAAARGLLQFIRTTADQLAVELNRANFTQDELYNPPTAIEFGAQYLSNLFKQFPDQPPVVAASYNGGEDNMARWLARAKTDAPDRYVPEIVFTQSKDYVYKVMANYRVYQMFYDANLKSK